MRIWSAESASFPGCALTGERTARSPITERAICWIAPAGGAAAPEPKRYVATTLPTPAVSRAPFTPSPKLTIAFRSSSNRTV